MAADAVLELQELEEVTESELSSHHERPPESIYRLPQLRKGRPNLDKNHDTSIPGIYGWRKRCLYFSLLLLLVIVVINFGLTLWILLVLDFNEHGMGNLRITESGIRLQGRAEFTDTLYAQTIASDQDSSLVLQSQQSINVTSGQSQMSVSPDTVTVSTPTFSVYTQDSVPSSSSSQEDRPVLTVTNQSIVVNAHSLEAGGSQGVTVEGGVVASSVKSLAGRDLSLEATGGKMRVVGGEGGLSVEGGFPGGNEGVEILSNADMTLTSQSGSVVLSSSSIQLVDVPTTTSDPSSSEVMEVCACASGKLYLVPASAAQGCQDDGGVCGS